MEAETDSVLKEATEAEAEVGEAESVAQARPDGDKVRDRTTAEEPKPRAEPVNLRPQKPEPQPQREPPKVQYQ
jgi:hypothetical protein